MCFLAAQTVLMTLALMKPAKSHTLIITTVTQGHLFPKAASALPQAADAEMISGDSALFHPTATFFVFLLAFSEPCVNMSDFLGSNNLT